MTKSTAHTESPLIAQRKQKRAKLSEAALIYGVSTKTLRRRIAEGKLTEYRMGTRLIVVDLGEVEGLFLASTAS